MKYFLQSSICDPSFYHSSESLLDRFTSCLCHCLCQSAPALTSFIVRRKTSRLSSTELRSFLTLPTCKLGHACSVCRQMCDACVTMYMQTHNYATISLIRNIPNMHHREEQYCIALAHTNVISLTYFCLDNTVVQHVRLIDGLQGEIQSNEGEKMKH